MNTVEIQEVNISSNRIEYKYHCTGEWAHLFSDENPFFVEYSCNIETVPKSIAIIPLLANLLPISWLYNARIIAPVCDEDFYYSISEFKRGYRDMYPQISFGGLVEVKKIEKNVCFGNRCASFFSGGLDAFDTLTRHFHEKPVLIEMWGADVPLKDRNGWEKLNAHLLNTADSFEVEAISVKSNFRVFSNERILHDTVYALCGDGWWHGFQHGIGMYTMAAPVSSILGIKTVYFASSFTAADKGKVTCASDPTIDNFVKFCGCNVVHDGYEFTRQMKVHNVTQFAKRTGKKIPLRVCWESTGGSNCCNCEKCWRTILGVYAEGFDPRNFGFEYDDFGKLSKKIYKNRELLKWHRESRYAPMQEVLRKNYSIKTVDPALRWFYKIDINQLGEVSFCRKVIRRCRRMAGRVKHKLLGLVSVQMKGKQ